MGLCVLELQNKIGKCVRGIIVECRGSSDAILHKNGILTSSQGHLSGQWSGWSEGAIIELAATAKPVHTYAQARNVLWPPPRRRSDFHQEFVDSVLYLALCDLQIYSGGPTDVRVVRPTEMRRRGGEVESSEGRWLTLCTQGSPFRFQSHLEAQNMYVARERTPHGNSRLHPDSQVSPVRSGVLGFLW